MGTNFEIDWATLPVPVDDGAAAHLIGLALPHLELPATDGSQVDLSALPGQTVVYVYPMTGVPGVPLPEGWNEIPGARGCTPQSCAFRDQWPALRAAGVDQLFGLSTQDTAYQREAAERLRLPFPLLSDASFELARRLRLPSFEVGGKTLLKRVTMLIQSGRIAQVWYPVFPPDRNAADMLAWLRGRRAAS